MIRYLVGDCREVLPQLNEASCHCCVTSPPYFALRSYLHENDPLKPREIGKEPWAHLYIEVLVAVFREVRRVLKDDGTLWVVLGDTYDGKNLCGIPWRLALAMRDDGWLLRQDIIWAKPDPMPENVLDRCTNAHEYVFLFAKQERYRFDARAISEEAIHAPGQTSDRERPRGYFKGKWGDPSKGQRRDGSFKAIRERRNRRSVWTVTTMGYSEAHYATYPPALIEPCILAGCPVGGRVLDPFGGAGTTALVADRLQRHCTLIELSEASMELARRRIAGEAPLLAAEEAAKL